LDAPADGTKALAVPSCVLVEKLGSAGMRADLSTRSSAFLSRFGCYLRYILALN
jgi:hypothetical protein